MSLATDEPTWEDIIAEAVRAGIAKVHTSFPAVIVAYDPTTQKATVQPVLRGRVDDPLLDRERPDIVPPSPIANLPVQWPSGATWSIHGPLLPGDPVTVLVAERSTDEWRALGVVDTIPLDARRFNLSDAVVLPGGRTFNPAAATTAPIGPTAIDPIALVLAGALVKLGGGPAAIQPLLHSTTFLGYLGAFLTALQSATDPAVSVAATAFAASLASGPPISLKVFTE